MRDGSFFEEIRSSKRLSEGNPWGVDLSQRRKKIEGEF